MRHRAALSVVSGCAALLVVAGALLAPSATHAADPPPPDFEFFKASVAPILETQCAECHANPRKRLGKFFLKPMPGRTVREAHHRDNFETVLGLIEPGNPAGSLWLLKALGPGQGGVTHKGGVPVGLNSREYGAMVDFINGVTPVKRSFEPPRTVEGQPDFAFFVARIAPTLAQVCAQCHAAPGQGKFSLVVAGRGAPLTLERHYANFRTVLGLSTPGKPLASRFLLKPLAVADGGVPHKGGDRIRKGDPNYVNWLAFLAGERGPELPRAAREGDVPVLEAALVLEAERMEQAGDLVEHADPVAKEQRWVAGGARGGRLTQAFRVPEAGDYVVALGVRDGPGFLSLSLDDGAPVEIEVPGGGATDVGPALLLDGKAGLRAQRGDLTLVEGRLRLDGRGSEASFLLPAEKDHRAIEALLRLPPEEDGGEDGYVLFDMLDGDNGKLAGLTDGGRRFVMGVIEGGQPRILATAKAFPPPHGATGRTVRVDLLDGVAIGRLDGQPLAFLHLDRHLGQGALGCRAHGVLEVERLAAIDQFPIHTAVFGLGPILRLPAGVHTLGVELPPGGPALDRVTLTLSDTD